jgi:sugar phosphate isomerase/epimerase
MSHKENTAMKMTRKEFLQTAAALAGAVALPATSLPAAAAPRQGLDEGFPASERKGPKRGVSIYSYANEYGVSATLEDCLAELSDLATPGTKMGLEILGNAHIDDYPNPSNAWLNNWYGMLDRYDLIPVEYGHWVDSKLYAEGPEGSLDTRESVEMLVTDIKLAARLGFTRGRTKVGMLDDSGTPVKNWREIIKAALPVAEKHNFRMLTEFHLPTPLKGPVMDEYMDFITKENCNPWFALNVDFSVFQTKWPPSFAALMSEGPRDAKDFFSSMKMPMSVPEDMIPLMPYIHCCHAKFNDMTDDCQETTTPYPQILKVLMDHGYNGYMMSEYEGMDKLQGGAWAAVRKQHVMMKRLLGEA